MKVFEFDYDLTMMVFFLSPDEKVYARYGGRIAKSPDARQSLAGLRYTMQSVLAEHDSKTKRFAPMKTGKPLYIRDFPTRRRRGGCIHCHQTREIMDDQLDREGKWSIDLAFRYPPPDNLGLKLEVDRGNIVENVVAGSPAAKAGLRKGDVLATLGDIPVHSFGDAQFALDRAPKKGSVKVSWRRGTSVTQGKIALPGRWRRTDISWRSSQQYLVPLARIYGEDLSAEERKKYGLSPKQLAFYQKASLPEQARKAGIRAGDIIYGIDNKHLEMEAYDFLSYFRKNYVKGEIVTVHAIRDGKRLKLRMKLE